MKILKEQKTEDIVYIDIETVRGVKNLEEGSPLYDSWEYKMRYSRESEKFEDGTLPDTFKDKAALYAEFGKIVCITIGKVSDNKLKLKSYAGHNEKDLLIDFCNTLNKLCAANKNLKLCGHAIGGFDLPYLMRRCIIHGIDLPAYLDTAHLKPWDLNFVLDTLTLWKGTGFYSASLINISTAMELPYPKSDINGSETSDVYYGSPDGLARIVKYCERDVATVCNIVRRIRGEEFVGVENSDIKVETPPLLNKIYNTKTVTTEDKEQLENLSKDFSDEDKKVATTIVSAIAPKAKIKIK